MELVAAAAAYEAVAAAAAHLAAAEERLVEQVGESAEKEPTGRINSVGEAEELVGLAAIAAAVAVAVASTGQKHCLTRS